MEILFTGTTGTIMTSNIDFINVSIYHDFTEREIAIYETRIDRETAKTFDRQIIDPERLRDAKDD